MIVTTVIGLRARLWDIMQNYNYYQNNNYMY